MTLQELIQEAQKLSPRDRKRLIKALREVSDSPVHTRAPKTKRERSLLELAGLGAELWQEIDVDAYLNDLRNEWGK